MVENNPTPTPDGYNAGRLVRVEAGAVTRDAILTLPEGTQGIVLLAADTPLVHQQTIALSQAFSQQGLGSLLVDLFSTEELQLDAETGYFRENTDIMQQRMIGVAEWLLQRPETEHCSVGYFGLGIIGAAALIAAAERPDVVEAVVAEGTRLDAVEEARLHDVTAPTLLFALEQDSVTARASQHTLEGLNVEKHFASLSSNALFIENKPLPEMMQLAGDWFQQHLTWVM